MPVEDWRFIQGYDNQYEISSLGNVLSHAYTESKLLKQYLRGNGYYSVHLQGNHFYVHHLVAEHFIGPRPIGQIIRHLDDNKSNNTVGNLAYGSHADNHADRVRNGIQYVRRFTAEKASEVRDLAAKGYSQTRLADLYETSQSHISQIVNGHVWSAA